MSYRTPAAYQKELRDTRKKLREAEAELERLRAHLDLSDTEGPLPPTERQEFEARINFESEVNDSLKADVDRLTNQWELEMSRTLEADAEVERLRAALLANRRSDGLGGYINCWCDSEMNGMGLGHTDYCIQASVALEEKP